MIFAKTKKFKTLLLLFLLFLAIALPVDLAYAGIKSEIVLDNASIQGKIDPAYWWEPSENPGVAYNGGIEFTADSQQYSRIVAIQEIENLKEAGYTQCFSAEIEFLIRDIPEGGRFGVFFGLSRLTGNPAATGADTSFVYFSINDGNLMCGISNYIGTERTEKIVQEETNIAAWVYNREEPFRMTMEVDVNGGIEVYIRQGAKPNGQVFCLDPDADCYTAGYFGFGQTKGGSAAKISQIQVNALTNATPQNSNIFTKFDDNKFNINELYTRNTLYQGGVTYIRPEENKLIFRNTKSGYLSTVFNYSNFELETELEDLQRTPVFDENLNLQTSISTGFSVALSKDYQSGNFADSFFYVKIAPECYSPTRQAEATAITLIKDNQEIVREILPQEYHLWSERISQGRAIQLKVSFCDGELSVFVKFKGEKEYFKGLETKLSDVAPGYIQIVSNINDFNASVCDNFAIGLLSIENKDYNRQIATLTNKDNTVQAYDYEYYDRWDDSDLLFNGRGAK